MPDITFFTPVKLTADYTFERSSNTKSIQVGDYEFTLTSVKPVHSIIQPSGRYDQIGYEETYTNSEISQEQTDRYMWQIQQSQRRDVITCVDEQGNMTFKEYKAKG